MKEAVIDVGTNSIKCTLAEKNSEGILTILMDRHTITRLGEGLSKRGILGDSAMERNCEALVDFIEMVKKRGARRVLVVGTMALRTAKNAERFLTMVEEASGISIQILTGEEEAYYSFLAVSAGLPYLTSHLLLFDIGGGSTEFILGEGGEIEESLSIDIGAVTTSEELLWSPSREREYKRALSSIERILVRRKVTKDPHVLVGMGGTVTTIGSVMKGMKTYDSKSIHGLEVPRAEVDRQLNLYAERGPEERRRIKGLHPKRSDVILGGVCIVKSIMEIYRIKRLIISDWGLRHGLLSQQLSG